MTGGQTALSLGSGMFIGGSSGYIDYTIRDLWDGRTPDAGKALESFAVGAMFGGAFTLGASWLSQGFSKIKGMGKGGAAPKGEVPRKAKPNELAYMGRQKQPFVSDLSHVTGKGAKARNRAIESIINSELSGINFIQKPQYSPFVNTGVAMKDVGTHIGKSRFSSRIDLINTIVHEELHHRWWRRGIPGYLHHSPDKYVPNERFYNVIDRYMKMKGYVK